MLSVALFSSSDDEEEYTANELRIIRKRLRQNSNIFALPNEKFISYFRLSKEAFRTVLEEITPYLEEPKRTSGLSTIAKLSATLRLLAEGNYQKGAGNHYNVGLSQASVSKAFNDCINVMYDKLCPNWISFTMDETEKAEIKQYFYMKTGFPGVIGCIDGTHIKILAPSENERSKYLNGKGYCSLNTIIVCDHKLRIRYISPHNPGKTHDSLVWNVSDIRQLLKQDYENGERNTWLIGNGNYPLEPYLMTPFRTTKEDTPERRFNYVHAQAINHVNRAIGVLKNRFKSILGERQLHYSPLTCGKITAVCAALHNICISHDVQFPENNSQFPQTNSQNDTVMNLDEDVGENSIAANIRIEIMESLIH